MPFIKNNYFNTTRVTVLFVFIAMGIGALALSEWIFDVYIFKAVFPNWPVIKVNTAIGIVSASVSLLLFTREKIKPALLFAFVVFFLGVITLCEYVFNWNAHIDEMFFPDNWAKEGSHPGRMPLFTTLAFIVTGISLFAYSAKNKWAQRVSELSAILIFIISFTGFIGSIYGAAQLFKLANLASFSIPTSLTGLLFSVAILFSKPEKGIIAVFNENTNAARAGARQILILMAIVLIAGLLCSEGIKAGFFDARIGISFMITAFVICFFLVTTWGILKLNTVEKDNDKLYKLQQENLARLNEAQRITHMGSWELDLASNSLLWSEEIYRIFEIDSEKFGASYEAFLNAIHPDDREMVNKAYTDSVKNKTVYSIEHRLLFPDGRIKFVHEHCETYYNKDGTPLRSAGTVQDITERKEAEKAIYESEEKFRTLVQQAAEGIFIVDMEGNYMEANESAALITGYPVEELKKMNVRDITDPDDLKKKPVNWEEIKKEKPVFAERTIIKKDKTQVNVEISSRLINNGRVISIFRDITERKRAENKIKESELKYRNIFEKNLAGIYQITVAGEILTCNDAFTKMFGYGSREELTGKNVEIFYPEKKGREKFLARLREKGELYNQELKLMNKYGDTRYMVENCILRNDIISGKEVIEGVIIDITEHKKAEEAVLKFNERFELIAATTHDAIWEWNLETDEIWANEMHQRLYGLTKADPVPTQEIWLERIHPDDRDAILEKQKQILNSGENAWISEYRFQLPGGVYINIYDRCYVMRNAEGKGIRLMGSMMDVTERKKAEEQVREQENRFRLLVDAAPDATVIVDEKGIIRIANLQAEKIFGYTKAELTGSPVEMLMPASLHHKHENLRREYLEKSQTRSMGSGRELIAVKKDGSVIPVEISLSPLPTPEGMLITAALRDITNRKNAEKALEESYLAVRRLSEHLQNIREEERTHIAREIHDELGQQLTILKMDVSWLNKRIGDDSSETGKKIKDLLAMLDHTIKTVRRISTELRPSVLDDLGLVAAMELHLNEFEKRSGIHIFFSQPETELRLTDPVKNALFRIFQESLTNVARHSGAKKVKVKLEKKKNEIVLLIEDNGVGFDERKASAKKTLGVLGMKERAAGIGGQYLISGKPGKGTTIMVTVPIHDS